MAERAMVEAVAEERQPGIIYLTVHRVEFAVVRFWSDGMVTLARGSSGLAIPDRPLPGESREAFALRIVVAR